MISLSLQLAFVLFLSNVLLYSAAPPHPPVSFWFSSVWGHGAQRCFSVWSCHIWGGAACPRRSFSGCWVQRATGIIRTGQKSFPEDPVSCWWQNHPFRSASLAASLFVVLPPAHHRYQDHTGNQRLLQKNPVSCRFSIERFLCSSGPFYRGGWCELSSSAHCSTTTSQGIWISTASTSTLYLNWSWLWSGLPKHIITSLWSLRRLLCHWQKTFLYHASVLLCLPWYIRWWLYHPSWKFQISKWYILKSTLSP